MVLCASVFGLLGAVSGSLIFGLGTSDFSALLSGSAGFENTGFLKYYNAMSTFGAWVASGYLLSKFRSYKLNTLWKFYKPLNPATWYMLLPLFVSAVFASAWLLEFNMGLKFPSAIESFFESFKTGNMLERMLQMNSPTDFLLNLLVIAVLPAVFEEIFFRGTLQPMIGGIFKNHHAGIILSSLIFALIHLNITQLIPMMCLSLLLGYLLHYSGSIYTSIIIHFLNNAMAVTAYYFKDSSELAKQVTDDSLAPGVPLFLFFSTAAVLIIMRVKSLNQLNPDHE